MAVTRATAAADLRNVMSKRVVALFRAAARDAPLFVKVYSLEQTPAQVRRIIMAKFREQAHIRDPRTIDLLLARGAMELEESRKQWKQRSHIIDFLKLAVPEDDIWSNPSMIFKRSKEKTLRVSDFTFDGDRDKQIAALKRLRAWADARRDGKLPADKVFNIPADQDVLDLSFEREALSDPNHKWREPGMQENEEAYVKWHKQMTSLFGFTPRKLPHAGDPEPNFVDVSASNKSPAAVKAGQSQEVAEYQRSALFS